MLYERDYHLGLTETEEQQYEEITGRKFWEKRVSGFGRVNNFMAYPKAARMCKSLFPNNYLDVGECIVAHHFCYKRIIKYIFQ